MSYNRDYIFGKILEKLPSLKINERRTEENSIFILEYNSKKAKVDIDSFVRKLGEKKSAKSDKKIEEFVYYIVENFLSQEKLAEFNEKNTEENIIPVIRATSFNKENKKNLLKLSHTNETDIYLAYNFDKGYKLLDDKILEQINKTKEELYEIAKINLAKLPLKYNKDEVAGNIFYFLNAKDGYDGARFLDKNVLDYFYKKIGGDYYIGLPHQDTLIIADVKNKKGLEILQKMMVHFFTEGLVPITTITFKYNGKDVESLFIFVE